MLNTVVDNKDALKKLRKLSQDAFPDAARNSLNNMAKGAGTYARSKTLKKPKGFFLRNKWTLGSMIPTPGKNFGLIPKNKKNINSMFSVMGSRQPYLLEQEEGFRKKSPSIPLSNASRKGKTFAGKIKPRLRLKNITKTIRTYRNVKSKAKTKEGKTFAMLSISARTGYQGFFFLSGKYFPRGIYKYKSKRAPAKKSGVPRMTRLRKQEKGSKPYKKKPWFKPITDKFQKQKTYDFYWNREVKKLIDPIFTK